MIYTVRVTETFQRDVKVRANSEREAVLKINQDWDNASLIIDPEYTQGIVTYVLEEAPEWTEEQKKDEDWASYYRDTGEFYRNAGGFKK